MSEIDIASSITDIVETGEAAQHLCMWRAVYKTSGGEICLAIITRYPGVPTPNAMLVRFADVRTTDALMFPGELALWLGVDEYAPIWHRFAEGEHKLTKALQDAQRAAPGGRPGIARLH